MTGVHTDGTMTSSDDDKDMGGKLILLDLLL